VSAVVAGQRRTRDSEERLQSREQQREDQREVTQFGEHGLSCLEQSSAERRRV